MNNLIDYNGYVIGYKNDLIKWLEEQSKRLRRDNTISNDFLIHYLSENENLFRELDNYSNEVLLAVGEGCMGEFEVKRVGVEIE